MFIYIVLTEKEVSEEDIKSAILERVNTKVHARQLYCLESNPVVKEITPQEF